MKTLTTLAIMITAITLATAVSCSESEAPNFPFAHRNAVFHAMAGNDTATSPVEKNFSMDKRGQPGRYQGGMLLQQGAIEIRHEFVGTTFCPVTADGNGWNDADVYVLVIADEMPKTETIPVVYKGGKMVVVDRPNLQVVLEQEESGPTPAIDLAKLGG